MDVIDVVDLGQVGTAHALKSQLNGQDTWRRPSSESVLEVREEMERIEDIPSVSESWANSDQFGCYDNQSVTVVAVSPTLRKVVESWKALKPRLENRKCSLNAL